MPGWRLSQAELYSILGSSKNPHGGMCAPPHHMSFWRPEREQASHAAGSITSKTNGNATRYTTAADRRLMIPGSIGKLEGALETGWSARQARINSVFTQRQGRPRADLSEMSSWISHSPGRCVTTLQARTKSCRGRQQQACTIAVECTEGTRCGDRRMISRAESRPPGCEFSGCGCVWWGGGYFCDKCWHPYINLHSGQ